MVEHSLTNPKVMVMVARSNPVIGHHFFSFFVFDFSYFITCKDRLSCAESGSIAHFVLVSDMLYSIRLIAFLDRFLDFLAIYNIIKNLSL